MEAGKLSFNLGATKRAAPKVALRDADTGPRREMVTGMSAAGALELAEAPAAAPDAPKVIPRLENRFKPGGGRHVPSFVPTPEDPATVGGADRFEPAAEETKTQRKTYGLQRMRPPANGREPPAPDGEAPAAANGARGRGAGGGGSSTAASSRDADLAALRADLATLPATASLEAYEAMPVEEFGLALLRGMGWQEGQGCGRKRQEVKPVEYVRRPDRLGLGAAPAPPQAPEKKYIKPGESRAPKKDLVYVDASGVTKHVKSVDERLVERQVAGPAPGKRMRITGGRHEGLACVVLALEPEADGRSGRAMVRLAASEETVSVRVRELGETDARPRESEREEGRSGREGERERRRDKDRAKDKDRDKEKDKEARRERKRERERELDRDGGGKRTTSRGDSGGGACPGAEPEPPWLYPHIRVRIVDKGLRGGRLYLKKCVVSDVAGPRLCDVYLAETRETVQGVRQMQLETVVPRAEGARVLVVRGPHRGVPATLLQRSAESGMAAVQLAADFSIQRLPLDDVAEYVGEDEG